MKNKNPLLYIIDQDSQVREMMDYYFKNEGFNVMTFDDALKCMHSIQYLHPDLIVMDTTVSKVTALEICQKIKGDRNLQTIKLFLISTINHENTVQDLFRMGADDYLSKPFKLTELNAKIRKHLLLPLVNQPLPIDDNKMATINENHQPSNKTRKPARDLIVIDELTINPLNHQVSVKNRNIDLTFIEFKLLLLLINKKGSPCSREEIIQNDGGQCYVVTDRAVDVRVAGLRKKLNEYGQLIKTIRSVGYMFIEN